MEAQNNTQEAVRRAVWPWDAPPTAASARERWQMPVIRLVVMLGIAVLLAGLGRLRFALFLSSLGVLLFAATVASPAARRSMDRALGSLGSGVGTALTGLVLVPFFFLCFLPARLFLLATGKDPLRRKFPAPGPTLWLPRTPPSAENRYHRQF